MIMRQWKNLLAGLFAVCSALFALAGAIGESLMVVSLALVVGVLALALKRNELRSRRASDAVHRTTEFGRI
jgi:hypothetical protein